MRNIPTNVVPKIMHTRQVSSIAVTPSYEDTNLLASDHNNFECFQGSSICIDIFMSFCSLNIPRYFHFDFASRRQSPFLGDFGPIRPLVEAIKRRMKRFDGDKKQMIQDKNEKIEFILQDNLGIITKLFISVYSFPAATHNILLICVFYSFAVRK